MTDIKALLLTLVTPLVEHSAEIEIDEIDTTDFYEYHLRLHPDDIGRVIGRQGRVARAIRTILYSVRLKQSKRVRLVICDDNPSHD